MNKASILSALASVAVASAAAMELTVKGGTAERQADVRANGLGGFAVFALDPYAEELLPKMKADGVW